MQSFFNTFYLLRINIKWVAIAIISCLLCSFSFPKIELEKFNFFHNSLYNFLGLENVILFVLDSKLLFCCKIWNKHQCTVVDYTMVKRVEILIQYGAEIRTRASCEQHRFSTIPRLKGSSVGRADMWKMASKADKIVTIVSYCKKNTMIRTEKVMAFQWYRSCYLILFNSLPKASYFAFYL